mgnify:FL=1
MKKMLKRMSMLVVAMAVLMTMVLPAFANPLNVSTEENEEIEMKYVVSCPSGGKHQMQGRGMGFVYYGSAGSTDLRISGTASQCSFCDLVLVTAGNPFIVGSTWGDYATWNPGYQVGTNVVMYTNYIGHSDSNNDPYVQGFQFARSRAN